MDRKLKSVALGIVVLVALFEMIAPVQALQSVLTVTIDPSVLAVFVLVTCLVCIYMVFFFGRRLETSAYLRGSLIEATKKQYLKTFLQELHEKALEGPLDPKNPPPEGYGPTGHLWEPDKFGPVLPPSEGHPSDVESPDQKDERLKREAKERQQFDAFRQWELDERDRYEKLRQQAEDRALKRAKYKIPRSLDISLLGGGWAFLLEFSTVIVIIFTLLIFGILGTLDGKDISTILAAIAGYVLGKATAGTRQQERPIDEEAANTSAAK